MAESYKRYPSLWIPLYFLISSQFWRFSIPSSLLQQNLEINGVDEVHCSRERSRTAWKIIEEYLIPYVEKAQYELPSSCRIHKDNDIYRDQEEHKAHIDINEWKCEYCKKVFYEEKYLDKHFNTRHKNLLNVSHGKCLADLCGALHCDYVVDTARPKSKCNPAAAARNRHLCESLADSCFPVSKGTSASRLHEFFLRQFCDAHTCSGGSKPLSKKPKKTSVLYICFCIISMLFLLFFYSFFYLYRRGLRSRFQQLKRIKGNGLKKKPFYVTSKWSE